MADVISIDMAGEIDAAWYNGGMGDDGLRVVTYKRCQMLTVPSLNGAAPTYQYRSHDPEHGEYAPGYYHVSGPTLAEWAQAKADEAERIQRWEDARLEERELLAWAGGWR